MALNFKAVGGVGILVGISTLGGGCNVGAKEICVGGVGGTTGVLFLLWLEINTYARRVDVLV